MKDYINEMLSADRWELKSSFAGIHLRNRNIIVMRNGVYMSVQASEYHYCTPRDSYGPYTHVEVGFPSDVIPELMEYADGDDDPKSTVYGYVPVEILNTVIHEAGGLVSHHDLANFYAASLAAMKKMKKW